MLPDYFDPCKTYFKRMISEITLKIARRLKYQTAKKILLQFVFRLKGFRLKNLYCLNNNRFFIYHVGNWFIPNESFLPAINYEDQFIKCKNESLFAYMPKEGDVILDIGAGLGEEVIFYSPLTGLTGKVISVEANPYAFSVLEKTVTLNDFTNVTCIQIAIYNKNGEVQLSLKAPSYDAATVTESIENDQICVPSIRLDKLFAEQNIKKVNLLKSNIEGAERFIIETLSPELLSMVSNIAIACHDFRYNRDGNLFYKTKNLVMDYFRENGFNIHTRQTGIDYLDDWVYGVNKNL